MNSLSVFLVLPRDLQDYPFCHPICLSQPQRSFSFFNATMTKHILLKNKHDVNVENCTLAQVTPAKRQQRPRSHGSFWVVIISLCLIVLTTSLDSSIIAIALPKSSTKYQMLRSSTFGSRAVFYSPKPSSNRHALNFAIYLADDLRCCYIVLFDLGSGVAGGVTSGSMLIAGGTIRGVGSGRIMLLIELSVCDITPMRERGNYLGIVLSSSAIDAIIGRVVGGVLAEAAWRWIFYLNLPIAGMVFLTMIFCLKLWLRKSLPGKRALARVDWFGSSLFIASMCSLLLGLIMGGAVYPWAS
jgi:hypothetical protein